MLEKNTTPQENRRTEKTAFDEDPFIERILRLAGRDGSTKKVGWIRYRLLLMVAFVHGFFVGFRESWPKTKMMVKEAWTDFKEDMKNLWAGTKQ